MPKVCVQVAEARRRLGLTVRELAPLIKKETGGAIGPSYVTDIEKGRGVPADYVAAQLAKVLGISPNSFLQQCAKERKSRKARQT